MGAFIHFATEATGFADKFPGIKSTILTLRGWFNVPFVREYMLANSKFTKVSNACRLS